MAEQKEKKSLSQGNIPNLLNPFNKSQKVPRSPTRGMDSPQENSSTSVIYDKLVKIRDENKKLTQIINSLRAEMATMKINFETLLKANTYRYYRINLTHCHKLKNQKNLHWWIMPLMRRN